MGSSTRSQSVYVSFDSGFTDSLQGKILPQPEVCQFLLLLFDFSYRNFLQGGILHSCFVSMTMTPQVFEQSLFLFYFFEKKRTGQGVSEPRQTPPHTDLKRQDRMRKKTGGVFTDSSLPAFPPNWKRSLSKMCPRDRKEQ